MPMIFSVYEDDTNESWIGSTILNDDQQAEFFKLRDAAELAGLEWESVRPDSYEALLQEIESK